MPENNAAANRKSKKVVRQTIDNVETAFHQGAGGRTKAKVTHTSGLKARVEANMRRENHHSNSPPAPTRKAGRAHPRLNAPDQE